MGAKAVIFKLIGDSKSAENAFKRVQRQAEESGKFFDKLRAKAVDLGGAFGPAGQSIAEAVTSPQAAIAATGAAIGKFVLSGVSGFTRLAEATANLQRATGATAEEASGFIAIGDDYNVTAQQLSGSLFRLAKNLGENGQALSQYGVSVARASDGSLDLSATVGNIADAYNRMSDPAQRATLLTDAFGRSGRDMVPILEQGSKGIRDLFAEAKNSNQILSDEDVEKGEEYRLAIDELQDAFQGLQREAGEALVPALTDVAEALTRVIEVGGTVGKPISWLRGINNWVTSLADKLPGLNHNLGGWQIATSNLGDTTSDTASEVGDLTDEIEEQVPAAEKLEKALNAVRDSADKVVRASESEAEASKRLADARADLNKLLATGKDGLTDYEEALKKVDAADKKVTDSEDAVADARRDVEDATKDVESAVKDVADATEDLADAQDKVGDAQERVLDAERAIADLRADAAEDAKDAAVDIAKGENDHAKALTRLSKAQGKLDQLRLGAETTAEGLAEAEQEVADAQLEVNESARDTEKAHRDLDQATATLAGTSDEAREAEETRKDAVDGLATALRNQETATQALIASKAAVLAAEAEKTAAVGTLTAKEGELRTAIDGRTLAQDTAHRLDDTDVQFADKVKEAKDKVAGAERGLRDAKRETASAAGEMITKQRELDDLINRSSLPAIQNLKSEYEALIRAHPELAATLGPALNLISASLQGAGRSVNPALNPRVAGPVLPGQTRAVPSVNPAVNPAAAGPVINVNVATNANPQDIASAIAWAMRTSGY